MFYNSKRNNKKQVNKLFKSPWKNADLRKRQNQHSKIKSVKGFQMTIRRKGLISMARKSDFIVVLKEMRKFFLTHFVELGDFENLFFLT